MVYGALSSQVARRVACSGAQAAPCVSRASAASAPAWTSTLRSYGTERIRSQWGGGAAHTGSHWQGGATARDPNAELRHDVADLRHEVQEKQLALLHARANFENDRKSLTEAREKHHRQAMARFADRMVDVYECFDSKLPTTASSAGDVHTSLHEGISLVRRSFASTLERFDVQPLRVEVGERFDPTRHEHAGMSTDLQFGCTVVTRMVKPGWILKPSGGFPTVLAKAKVRASIH